MTILSLFNADFLVRITDFGVLIALAFVTFAAVWSRKSVSPMLPHSGRILPALTGLVCLLIAGALYFVDPNVVLFGIIFIMIGYLLFDIFELGAYGSQIFLAVLYVVFFGVTGIIARSPKLVGSQSTIASFHLLQNVLEAAIAIFVVDILIESRLFHRIEEPITRIFRTIRQTSISLASLIVRSRRRANLDRAIDRWIRLMGNNGSIMTQNQEYFATIKNYLEARISTLKDKTKP
jgi:hypothetical protein